MLSRCLLSGKYSMYAYFMQIFPVFHYLLFSNGVVNKQTLKDVTVRRFAGGTVLATIVCTAVIRNVQ